MLKIDKNKFLKDLFKVLVDNGITPDELMRNDDNDDIGSIITSRKTIKTKTLVSYKSSSGSDSNIPDPNIIVDNREYPVYALVSISGYTACLDVDYFEHQSGYFSKKGMEWKGFECIEDAMEWLLVEVPKHYPSKNLQLASPEYLFQHGGYWYKTGFKCDPEEIRKWVYKK